MARRLLSIWFPRLASDTSLRNRPIEGPFALTLRSGNSDHLHCVNPCAMARGLRRGMTLADARAICPDLATRPADLAREATALATLRRWTGRYAPMVGTDGVDGLIADISGVSHLFGGEVELREDLQARMDRAGLATVTAIAGTRGAAHALARHGGGIVADGSLAIGIGHLPVTALRVDHDTAEALARMGLSRISDLIPLPRAPLARRFGQGLVLRLDQALGAQAEPVAAEPDPPHFGVRMTLPEPIGLQSDVMAGLARLLERLCAKLTLHRMGARRVRFELRRVDSGSAVVEIGLARPMRDPIRIAALFAKGVDEIDSGFGIDGLRLSAPLTEAMAPEQVTGQIGDGPTIRHEDALADLLSSIGNRIGFDRVQRLLPATSLIPERSFLIAPAAYSSPEPIPQRSGPGRPITLFPPEPVTAASGTPPANFRWRRMRFTTLRATGPERITPEWWFDDPAWRSGLRDYWRIDTQEGPRLWLFVTPQTQDWYMQGEFA
ncbi:DNA polymerase Y family protein [Cypionkella sp.]|uniref:Y-family DNA polymerase n=1 Tax=Cypionkella sp. TaxID=2811411 RepID=UPI00272642F1|nr:DNA polymerase Y family protein [Cypionkella sp.]MDO8985255.1 DNA polymerase Y family protein [Cypionkella sp.]MDP2051447.1 DNA polymerase Y family protein [Cypionkella sp.]